MALTSVNSGSFSLTADLSIYRRGSAGDGQGYASLVWGNISCELWGDVEYTPGDDNGHGILSLLGSFPPESYEFTFTATDYTAGVSITVDDSIIDRDRTANVYMGSDAGPTHSNEMDAADEWTTPPSGASVSVTFGPVGLSCTASEAGITPATTCAVGAGVDSAPLGGTNKYGEVSGVTVYNAAPDFSPIGEVDLGGNVWFIGSGNSIYAESRGIVAPGGGASSTASVPPLRVVSWANCGIADWEETTHNSRYDNVLVWGGFVKAEYMNAHFTWPDQDDTDNGGTGAFAYGDSIPVRLGELRALGAYTQLPSTSAGTAYEYEFWPTPTLYLRVDQESARAHNIYTHSGQYIILGLPDLTATDCSSDPHFDLQVTHTDIDADLSGSLGSRATAWTSGDFAVTGGGIGTTGNVTFTVPAAGGTLERTLYGNWLPRCEYYIAAGTVARWPEAYFWHENNGYAGGDGWTELDEDVTWWASHRYLKVGLTPTGVPVDTAFTVRVSYSTETVTDNHLTGSDRAVTAALTAQTPEEYSVTWSANALWVDLWKASRPRLQHVTKVEIDFPAEARAWTFTGMDLMRHSDDDPARSEVTPHGLVTFHEPKHDYIAGGARAVMDGKCREVLCTSANYQTYSGHEYLVEHINWYFGSKTGTDLSAAWALETYLVIMSYCCEGWEWALPANWTDMTTDAASGVLTTGYSFDLEERQDHDVDAGAYPARFGIHEWDIAPSILYAPYGLLVVQGGIHGTIARRSTCCGKVYRREAGTADPWVLVTQPTTDGHGYWSTGEDLIARYDSTTPMWYEYRVDAIIARLYERQWEWARLIIGGAGKKCGVYTDPDGVTWYAWIEGTDILIAYMQDEYSTFSATITVDSTGDYDAVDLHGDGRLLIVGARNSSDEKMYSFHSTDMGSTWNGPYAVG